MKASPYVLGLILLVVAAGCKNPSAPDGENLPPRILSLVAQPQTIAFGETAVIIADVAQDQGATLTYSWNYLSGNLVGSGKQVYFTPDACCSRTQRVTLIVSDNKGGADTSTVTIWVE